MKKYFLMIIVSLCLLLSACASSAPDSVDSAPAAEVPEV